MKKFGLVFLTFILIPLFTYSQATIHSNNCSLATSNWTFTDGGGVAIQQSGYWLVDNNNDYIISETFDVSGYENLSLTFQVATYGSGTNNSCLVEYSTDNGVSWSVNNFTSTTPTSSTYISAGTWNIGTLNTNQLKFRWSRPATTGRGVRIDNILFQGVTLIPNLSINPTNLSGFTYILGNGPSTSQFFKLSGSNLTPTDGNLTVTGSANYEVSINNTDFYGSINVVYTGSTLISTNIYVRLRTDLPVASYSSEIISNTGGGATEKTVICDGSVTVPPPPTLYVTPTTLSGFTYFEGSGPSTSLSYSLSGVELTGFPGNIVVTALTNYEVSLDNTSFSGSVNVPFANSNLSSTIIYIRLKTGLSIGTYNGELISNAGGGATTVNVICNGTVSAPLPIFPLVDEFNYNTGTLLTNNGWNAHSGTGTNPIAVNDFGLNYTDYVSSGIGNSVSLDNNGEDDSKIFTPVTTGIIFYSFLVNVVDGTEGYFIHLGNSASSFASRIFVKPSVNNGKINFGISNSSTASYSLTPTDFDLSTTYLIIVKYDLGGTNTSSFWVCASGIPISEIAAGVPEHTTSSSGLASVERICLRQYSATQNIIIDGIRVSDEWIDAPMPVELSSFSATTIGKEVKLSWNTATEVNNYGFEVERSVVKDEWSKIGFVNGNGNSNSPKDYSFVDDKVTTGKYSYRLKQIDNDGQFEYSKVIEIDVNGTKKYELTQNYPNPFNPTTTIQFQLPQAGMVKLTLYNILGQELQTLVNETKEAGTHTVNFDASELNSGVYVYKIESGSYTQTKKMTLVK